MKHILKQLIAHQSLSKEQAKSTLTSLALGEYNLSEMAAFISCYLMRTITVDELEGFRDAMLELCIPINLKGLNTIDLCGTGGDGKDTFNISTLASFVVAGAGQCVTKHGNNGVSSVCGSSNVLAYLGYEFTNTKEDIYRNLETAGIAFLHAPLFHPAMKNVAHIRKELGMKTFFNMLGPLVNPAQPLNQLIGVFNHELARLYEYLFQKGDKNYCILHSLDGYDEISLTGDFKCITNKGLRILSPHHFKMKKIEAHSLKGGKTIKESAIIFLDILSGNGTPEQNNVVISNAAMALQTAKRIAIDEAVLMAQESLASGNAFKSLKKLIVKPEFQYLS